MKRILYILFVLLGVGFAQEMQAQVDRKDVRRGNRDFKKESWREAEIDYRKALVKDSLSVAANYNLANTLYREGDFEQARKVMETVKDVAPASASAADYFYNLGDAAIACEDWQAAVDAFKESLLRNPGDLDAKENYIYAKKKLEDQQNQQNQQNQNQDQNQNTIRTRIRIRIRIRTRTMIRTKIRTRISRIRIRTRITIRTTSRSRTRIRVSSLR